MSETTDAPRPIQGLWLTAWMVAAIGAILGGAVWFGTRANDAAIESFSQDQAVLAAAVAIDFETRLGGRADDRALVDAVVVELLAGAKRLEKPGELLVLIARPNQPGFLTTDGRVISSTRIREALDHDVEAVVLPRDEAATFGLTRRRAVAGVARVSSRTNETWGVVVLASAVHMRERQEASRWRLALTTVFGAGAVAAIGAYARRRMRRALELERDRERELALTKADKMATVAALSTGIAHEVGTPLAVIVGRVEQVLARPATDERTAAALKIVLEQVERIERIVRGSLALARGDAPQLVPTPPSLVARRATDLVRHRFEKANVELTTTLDEGSAEIACDPSLFEQALVNLLLNACEATAPGGRVTLDVKQTSERVAFVVEDEGAGIPDTDAERAAEPFFSTKRGAGGTGLGLTIAREIVKHHNGELTVARREAGGTRATITAPIARSG
ncbi:MAG: hypothetical protein KIT84_05965 [Labilithrix sp.]|nr:hypothetical protein [Labilithrix sp.]MCW5810536.1 hypothetical protein [Labilithrix sp.]